MHGFKDLIVTNKQNKQPHLTFESPIGPTGAKMQFHAGSYVLNIHRNFMKLFVKLEKHISFVGI